MHEYYRESAAKIRKTNEKLFREIKEELEQIALNDEKVKAHVGAATIRKVICVPGKLVNVVAK